MTPMPEGNAIVYCQGAYGTTYGKTAHGLVRRTLRYRVLSVVDRRTVGSDAGEVIDGKRTGVPIFADIGTAVQAARRTGHPATHLVIGLATDGGYIDPEVRRDIIEAIERGLSVDSGLHEFLTEDEELARLACEHLATLRDVRKPPPRGELHFFSGKIEQVDSLVVAVLGTDSAVGKRTTAWIVADALRERGLSAELIGTGQTAWMQGVRYGIIIDSLVNDFVAGEVEHIVWRAWKERRPDVIIIEGQGSLMNPAYPGGFEILAAGRPDCVILQHAPARREYDGFAGYPLHPIERQIQAVELLFEIPVVSVTVNHEGISDAEVPTACADITKRTGLPTTDVLISGGGRVVEALMPYLNKREVSKR